MRQSPGPMIQLLLAAIAAFAAAVVTRGGYLGIVLMMAMISAGVPVPSELVLPFAGYLVTKGVFTIVGIAVAATIGENIGAAIGYEIGSRGGRALIARYGRFVLLDEHHVHVAERFFVRWGSAAALIGRLLPVIRTFIALPAGVARMNRVKFHVFTTLGSFPWCYALAWVGVQLGDKWNSDPRLKEWFHRADAVIVGVGVLLVAGYAWHRWRSARRSRA